MRIKSWTDSEKTIFNLLSRGPQTHGDLVLGCSLCPRTIRYSLARLKERGLLQEKLNIRDMRRIIYSLKSSQGV